MAIVAQLATTSVPSTSSNGAVSGTIWAHVTVAPAGGAGTYTFLHNLQWTPTFCFVIPQLAEATNPSGSNACVGWCFADLSSTLIAINVAGNGTYHCIYG